MIRIVPADFNTAHPLGVTPITSVEELVNIVKSHNTEKGERYCPLFVALADGIRLERWVALVSDKLLIRTEFGGRPEEIPVGACLESRYLGRYIKEARLFYDRLELEMPSNPRAMQMFS